MSKDTFLLKYLQENKPFVVSHLDDRIYEVEDPLEESDNFIEIYGMRTALEETSDIRNEENFFFDEDYVNEVITGMQERIAETKKKQKQRSIQDDKLLVIEFINYFFDNWLDESFFDSEESQKDIVIPEGMPEIQINAGESSSIMKRTLAANKSYLFRRHKCFSLIEKEGVSPSGERVVINGKNYWPQFESTAKEFDSVYSKHIKSAFEQKVNEFYAKENARIIQQMSKLEEAKNNSVATHKEDINGLVGFVKIGKDYYVYINRKGLPANKGYYKIPHAGLEKTFGWFPPCKLGLHINANDGKLKYDFDAKVEEINIKVLHPAQYEHPAVRDDNDPYLCLRAADWSYKGLKTEYSWNQRKHLFHAIKEIFKQASFAIRGGFAHAAKTVVKDSRTGEFKEKDYKSHVYHGGLDTPKFKPYEMDETGKSKKPIGWADAILKKGIKK